MEDALRVKLRLLTRYTRDFDFFGVYFGHGGSRVAYAFHDRLHWLLVKQIEQDEEDGVEMTSFGWEKVRVGCFEKMDEETSDCRRAVESKAVCLVVTVGSTAVVGEEEVVVTTCGDSRVVLSRGGVTISLSDDHKVI
ncbi:Protein phosphatase 2C 37 [Camellia lanceoleosa]|uniref:Protein phosphatase 2C 37 n=1 Tax=Camellia lanceoleosa TaxID=1840588 RepID=A0ACC0H7H3_9ERIC|nr:Protein phosphatase 2C 37 [Camellia lanceoleosa]